MWVEQLASGKYKYFERYRDPYTAKMKRVSVTLDKNTRQARNQAATLLQQKINDKLAIRQDGDNITFGDLLDEFFKSWKQGVKASTALASKGLKGTLLDLIPSDYLISKIDRRFLQKIIDDLLSCGKTRSYIYKIKNKISQALKYAVRMGYIDTNPMAYVELPRKITTKEDIRKKEAKILDKAEFKALMHAMDQAAHTKPKIRKYMRIATVLYLTGMRYGELAGLDYRNDIDFNNSIIHIRHTYSFSQGKRTTPKTAKSDRVVPVPQKVLNLIIEQVEENIKRGVDTSYIFINSHDRPVTPAIVIRSLKRYGKQAGINKSITTHTFRHSHISLLAEIGIPLPAIMDRVGHTDATTTLEIYSHVTEQMTSDIISKLNGIDF